MKTLRNASPIKVLWALLMLLFSLSIFIPILNIFAKSLSHPDFVHKLSSFAIFPEGFSTINYKVVLGRPIVMTSIVNSVIITILGTLLNLLLTGSAAYVLTRPNLAGKQIIMVFLIIMMIFEPGLVQEYFLVKHIGMLDKLAVMVLYKGVNVYYLIVLMRFFEEIPASILEAADIDGAGHIRKLFSIVIPLNRIALLTIGMFYGVYHWNEFFKSSIFLTSQQNTVLQVMLREFVINSETEIIVASSEILANSNVAQLDNGALKATTIVISMIPILLMYPLILKHYASGVMSGGVKE